MQLNLLQFFFLNQYVLLLHNISKLILFFKVGRGQLRLSVIQLACLGLIQVCVSGLKMWAYVSAAGVQTQPVGSVHVLVTQAWWQMAPGFKGKIKL